ncbi:MAG: DUF4238 domain-containing protein [Dehalococcoidia bacterium]|nr:DUF4238 domain-containing protein [Dehalococcoidia bacterium]
MDVDVASTDAAKSGAVTNQVTRANHYVPRGLLKRWSRDGKTVQAYDLLVPDDGVPLWAARPIRGAAMLRDLYTDLEQGIETDELERWFANEIEAPGLGASERVILRKRIRPADWHAMIRMYMAQEIRTLQSYFEQKSRWESSMQEFLERTLREGIEGLELARKEGRALPAPSLGESSTVARPFSLEVIPNPEPGTGGVLAANVVVGRRLWLSGIPALMQGRAMKTLLGYHWSILMPADGFEWPLTDHPALRLGASPRGFNFQAGVGQRRADLMMPLSPQHLLHVEVGKRRPGFHKLSVPHTKAFRHALVMRAFRTVFATQPSPWIPRARPRMVDRERWNEEQAGWRDWHHVHLRADAS